MTFDSDSEMADSIYKLNLSLLEVEKAGEIGTKSLLSLIKEGKLDRTIVSKAGAYDNQTLKTIVRTKRWDLKKGYKYKDFGFKAPYSSTDPEVQNSPICFWAFGSADNLSGFPELVRNLGSTISDFPETPQDGYRPLFTGTESHYVLMPLTDVLPGDNASTDEERASAEFKQDVNPCGKGKYDPETKTCIAGEPETMDDFRDRIAVDEQHVVKSFSVGDFPGGVYPEVLFPEIAKTASYAFVVSDLWISQEWMDTRATKGALQHFLHVPMKELPWNRAGTAIRTNGCAIRIKEEEITEYVDETPTRLSEYQRWLIARIEYPYIVKVSTKKADEKEDS